jgi:GT2 family glycosyltransferase
MRIDKPSMTDVDAEVSVMVSILAFNNVETIQACVASALALEHPGPLEVWIREQGQDDRQFAAIEAAVAAVPARPNRRATLTRGANLGFAAGHNQHIRMTSSDFVLLLNADAVLQPDFLRAALAHVGDPAIGSIQGKLLRPRPSAGPTVIDTLGFRPTRRRVIVSRGTDEEDLGQYGVTEEIFGADGAAPLYRRSALDDIAVPRRLGPPASPRDGVEYLDETFFAYKCDFDVAWRLRLRGWRCLFVPEAQGMHVRTSRRPPRKELRAVIAHRRGTATWLLQLSFANHRLAQIKNEQPRALARDLLPWLPTELFTWGVALIVQRGGLRAVGRLCRLAPTAWRKRRWIKANRPATADPYVWFT